MLPAPNTPTSDPPQPQRLPNYLLSASPSPSPAPFTPTQSQTPRHQITFNDRLREDRLPPISTHRTPEHRTPSRKPPNKSLLDVGPPSIHSLRSPSASPAAASLAPTTTPSQPATERWVTVFGFPPALESQALREFRRHGEVVRTVPGRGNWVHVLYRTPMQAQVALHKAWRLLAGTDVMVGAVPCTEPNLAKENDDAVERGVLVASPGGASPSAFTTGVKGASPATPATAGLRTPASILRRDPGGTPQGIVRTPQRQSGLLDYITGFYK